jgi:uncharacterized protein YuzB (UPF0349 family)
MNKNNYYTKMVRYYYRSRRKFENLVRSGKNLRKQLIIRKRLLRLQNFFKHQQAYIKKISALTLIAGSSLVFQPSAAQGQISFKRISENPLGFSNVSSFSTTAIADLDNDGDLDMMSGDIKGQFNYFENTGSDTVPEFGTGLINPFGLNNISYGSSIVFADLDNDGDIDIIAGDYTGGFFYFQNTGTSAAPAFAPVSINPFGLSATGNFSTPAVADLDNDGDLDIMSGTAYGDYLYFLNTGTNTAPAFSGPVTNPFGIVNIGYDSAPTFADIDNDGDLDLIAGEYDGHYFYFQNTGSNIVPVFAAPVANPFGLIFNSTYSEPAFADMDNDGDLEMISGGSSGHFYYYKNTGSNTTPVFVNASFLPFDLTGGTGTYNVPAIIDLDHDGDLDIMSGDDQGNYVYYQNNGNSLSPSFAAAIINPFGITANFGNGTPGFGDFDNDGDLDIMSGTGSGTFVYTENTGTNSAPAFSTPVNNPFGITFTGTFSSTAIADLDNDGDLDILSGEGYGHYFYFQNTGSNTSPAFALGVPDPFGLTMTNDKTIPAFIDLDHDGDYDLIVGDGTGSFYYFENTGTNILPNFVSSGINPFGLIDIGTYSSPAFGDLDGDGDLDLLSGDNGTNFYYFQNTSIINSINDKNSFVSSVVNVFPNPSHDKLNINFLSKFVHQGNIRLTDMNGREVFKENINQSTGQNLSIPVYQYPKGIYMLVVEGDGMVTQRVKVILE